MKAKKAIIEKTRIVSPGLIDGTVHIFLPSDKNTYFVKKDGEEEYKRDPGGKFVKLTLQECMEAREKYLAEFGEKEKEAKILEQMQFIRDELTAQAKETISFIVKMECYRDGKLIPDEEVHTHALGDVLNSLVAQRPEIQERNKVQANLFFLQNPTAIEIKKGLAKLLTAGDFESLHSCFNHGKPVLSVKHTDPLGMNALINMLHINEIDKTVDELKSPEGNIRIAARAIVEREY